MNCTSMAGFSDRRAAIVARRGIQRASHIAANIVHCGVCDNFHLLLRPQSGLYKQHLQVLRLIALGYTRNEIAKELKMTPSTARGLIYRLLRRFNALNYANLTAIAIALGVFDPCEFVPSITERNHP